MMEYAEGESSDMGHSDECGNGDRSGTQYGTFFSTEELGTSLHDAAKCGRKARVKRIFKTGIPIDYCNKQGQTPLFVACHEDHEDIVAFLLRKGANPNARTRRGTTPVQIACMTGNTSTLARLLEAGGDLRLHDNQNRSTSDYAAMNLDVKKKHKMINFIKKARQMAILHSDSGKSLPKNKRKPSLREDRRLSLGNIFKVKSSNDNGNTSVHNLGFGKICVNSDSSGALATIPMIPESSLRHDQFGFTYDNGPFMVMESMMWNKVQVTARRLHSNPAEGGVADLLIAESENMAKLRHPNILLLLGICQTNNLNDLILIYERVGLGSLYNYLYITVEPVEVWAMCGLMRQICDAVLYLHQNKLLHCAISSHTIQIVSHSVAKLANLEYMVLNKDNDGMGLKTGAVENKWRNAVYNWMAPEVMAGDSPSEVSDLYSLCAVIWEILHGCVPWSGMDAEDIIQEVVHKRNCLYVDQDKAEPPFDRVLKIGLNDYPGFRELSVETLRDYMIQAVVDREHIDISRRSITPRPDRTLDTLDGSHMSAFTPRVRSSTPARVNSVRRITKIKTHDGSYSEAQPKSSKKSGSTKSKRKSSPRVKKSVSQESTSSRQTYAQSFLESSKPSEDFVDRSEETFTLVSQLEESNPFNQSDYRPSKPPRFISPNKSDAKEETFESKRSTGGLVEQVFNELLKKTADQSLSSIPNSSATAVTAESTCCSSTEKPLPTSSSAMLQVNARKALFKGPIPFKPSYMRISSTSTSDRTPDDKKSSSSSLMQMPRLTTSSSNSHETSTSVPSQPATSGGSSATSPEITHTSDPKSPGKDNPFKTDTLSSNEETVIKALASKSTLVQPRQVHTTMAIPNRHLSNQTSKTTVYGALLNQEYETTMKQPLARQVQSCLGGRRSSFRERFQNHLDSKELNNSNHSIHSPNNSILNSSAGSRSSWAFSPTISGLCGNFKPASHRQSLDHTPIKTTSAMATGINSTIDVSSPIPSHFTKAKLSLSADRATSVPQHIRVQDKDGEEGGAGTMKSYRSETYLETGPATFPKKHSPREHRSQWYGGRGSIKDLIKSFQEHAEEHLKKQAILHLKKPSELMGGQAYSLLFGDGKSDGFSGTTQIPSNMSVTTQYITQVHPVNLTYKHENETTPKQLDAGDTQYLEGKPPAENIDGAHKSAQNQDEESRSHVSDSVEDENLVSDDGFDEEDAQNASRNHDELDTNKPSTSQGAGNFQFNPPDNVIQEEITDLLEGRVSFSPQCSSNRNENARPDDESDTDTDGRTSLLCDQLQVDKICGDLEQRLDVEDIYFDDVIHPDLYQEKHMRLQATLGLDSSGLPTPKSMSTPQGVTRKNQGPPFTPLFPPSVEEDMPLDGSTTQRSTASTTSQVSSEYQEHGLISPRRETLTLTNVDSEKSDSSIQLISGPDNCVQLQKIVDIFQDDGFSSSLTVESKDDGSGTHTITHSMTDLQTGHTTTTYQKTVKAEKVVTRLVTMDDDTVDV